MLHWFTGSIKDAEHAIELGCWFSINPNMCFTNAGRNLISCIPLDRLLPETDAPFTRKGETPYLPWDTTVIAYLAEVNKMNIKEMDRLVNDNLCGLIGIDNSIRK